MLVPLTPVMPVREGSMEVSGWKFQEACEMLLNSNSKFNTTGPDGLWCCHAKDMSTHVSAEERETLSLSMAQGRSLWARVLRRAPSTVSRELIRLSL
jgi:hypothetical protein